MGKELVGGSLILFNHISIKLSKRALYLSKCCILYPADYLPDIFFLPILAKRNCKVAPSIDIMTKNLLVTMRYYQDYM